MGRQALCITTTASRRTIAITITMSSSSSSSSSSSTTTTTTRPLISQQLATKHNGSSHLARSHGVGYFNWYFNISGTVLPWSRLCHGQHGSAMVSNTTFYGVAAILPGHVAGLAACARLQCVKHTCMHRQPLPAQSTCFSLHTHA